MKKFLSVLSLAGLITLIPAAAQAQDDDIEGLVTTDSQEQELPSIPRIQGPITVIRPAALVFAGFDQNGDYGVDRAETQNGARIAFGRADKDKNGKISLFELEDWRELALGSMDALPGNLNFDKDYNNQISNEEFQATFIGLFERHDANADGIVKHNELMQILEVPARKGPEKERQTDRECYEQIQRNRRY